MVVPMLAMVLGYQWMLPPWLQWALATPVQFYFGARFYHGAWGAVKAKTGNMDLLVAIGRYWYLCCVWSITLCLVGGIKQASYATPLFRKQCRGIELGIIGQIPRAARKKRTTSALKALESLRPTTATVWRNEQWQSVAAASVKQGERLRVTPGDRIAVDGKITSGQSHVDEALISGESIPVEKSAADESLVVQ